MTIRFALAALLLATAPQAIAQDAPPPATAPIVAAPRPATVRVALQTSEGQIVLELEKERAPITTANFLRYVESKRYDGMTIYRAANIAPGFGLVQGGIRTDASKLYPPIAHEPTSKTGLSHHDGTVSMARLTPGSAQADFFIIVGEMPTLDADPKASGDNLGFAAFGRVVEGMDIVRRILVAPTSPTEGAGTMKGQMLSPPVKIVSARKLS